MNRLMRTALAFSLLTATLNSPSHSAKGDKENTPPSTPKRKVSPQIAAQPKKQKLQQTIDIRPPRTIETIKQLDPKAMGLNCCGTNIVFWDLDLSTVRPKRFIHNFDESNQKDILDKFNAQNMFDGQDFDAFKSYVISSSLFGNSNHIWEESLIEDETKTLMQSLQKEGVLQIGLTARHPCIADGTHSNLKALGIDFEALSKLGTFQSEDLSLYNGIVYTANQKRKVTLIPEILKVLEQQLQTSGPYEVTHIDDSAVEIDAFATAELESPSSMTIKPVLYTFHGQFMKELLNDPMPIYQEIDEKFYYKRYKNRPKEEKISLTTDEVLDLNWD